MFIKKQTKNNAQAVTGCALEGRRPRRPSVDDVDVVIPVIRGSESLRHYRILNLFNTLMIISGSDYY